MQDKQPQEENALESIVSDLRDEYSRTAEHTELEAPKAGKELRMGSKKSSRLNILSIFVVLLSIIAGAFLLNLNKSQDVTESTANYAIVDDIPLEDLAGDAEPTLPATMAVPLPEPIVEQLPTEEPVLLPEVTPWPTPPLTTP